MTKRWIQSADIAVDDATGELLVRVAGSITPKRVKIDCASDAAAGNELVAAVAGKKICVLAACLMAATAVNATFYSGPADTGTALTGPMPLGDTGGFVCSPPAAVGMAWLATEVGQSLTLKLDAANQASGLLVYFEE